MVVTCARSPPWSRPGFKQVGIKDLPIVSI